MVEPEDNLGYENNQSFKSKIGDEKIYYSDKIQKKIRIYFLKHKKESFL